MVAEMVEETMVAEMVDEEVEVTMIVKTAMMVEIEREPVELAAWD